jgi:hypothetical protein
LAFARTEFRLTATKPPTPDTDVRTLNGRQMLMANNRMWLVHKPTGSRILLGKYYPSTKWYCFHSQDKIDEWFEAIPDDETIDYMEGDTRFELEYETVSDAQS